DLGALFQQRPQRLIDGTRQPEGGERLAVPVIGELQGVGRAHEAAALRRSAAAGKLVVDVERSVVVGELFAGQDVANGDLEVEAGAAAAGLARVVDEPAVIPAQ